MYHPTTRVLAVLELVQAHGQISGPDLAARLEVDLRTIRRYVTILQDLGIPLQSRRGRYGGYHLRAGYKLPPLMLNDDEALAVSLGLLTVRRLGLAVAAPAVEGALAKIERVLPPSVRQRVASVQQTLETDLHATREAPTSAVVVALSAAAADSRRVWLRHATSEGAETERAFDPYGLVYLNNRWYVSGYCHLRHDLRTFRLDRVRAVEPRQEHFVRPADFDGLAYVSETLAQMPGVWQVEVLLRTSAEEARRHVPPHVATLEETPEGVVLRDSVDSLDWMARQLVTLDCPFVVRTPPELRGALRRLAHELAAAAEAKEPAAHPPAR
ncbi:MAG: YafY family transcriptional regulator [Chloroflexota bacterium]|nr:YafY family transcriptional regulator [Chloroflexota bacterium]